MEKNISFEIDGLEYKVCKQVLSDRYTWFTEGNETVPSSEGRAFDTVAEAQQDALRFSQDGEEYVEEHTEQDEDDYHRAQQRLSRNEA